jgi:hypothetical protein
VSALDPLDVSSGNEPSWETEGKERMRHRGRIVFSLVTLALAVVVLAPSAWAASSTPEQIYQDYASHGKLTKQYSRADLSRALRDATLKGYGKPTVNQGAGPAIQRAMGPASVQRVAKPSGGLPFTGVDLGLMVLGGAGLLAFGAGLRRLGRGKA